MNEHERTLQSVLSGDLPREAPEVAAHLAECEDCRDRLERLLAVRDRLDEFAREERSDLGAAPSPEEQFPKFEAALQEQRRRSAPAGAPAGDGGGGASAPFRGRLLAAAASLLVAAALWGLWTQGGGAVDDRSQPGVNPDAFLGEGEGIVLIEPLVAPALSWSYELPPGGYFEIQIVDETDAGAGAVVVRRSRIEKNAWSPADSILPVELPARFRLTIDAFDGSGTSLESLSVSLPR